MTQFFPQFNQANVAVIGDVMVDRYIHGTTGRISPEAPVPVVNFTKEECIPGGAANVAVNLASLGVSASLCGVVGKDEYAEQLKKQLASIQIKSAFNQSNKGTILKTRVLASNQQLLRIDRETPFADDEWPGTMKQLENIISHSDVVLLSDYAKGTLLDCQAIIKLAKNNHCRILVDPKGSDFEKYRGADLLTPNLGEFTAVVGAITSEKDFNQKAQDLIEKLNLQALLVTRSEEGMTLFRKDQPEYHLPALKKSVADVTGAGDTVIATVAAALGAGAEIEHAVNLANLAASIVVSRVGTSSVAAPELELAFHKTQQAGGLLSIEQLQLAINLAKARNEKVVFTNGCFDILHAGHVAYLDQARKLGDRLIVAINTDESVTKLKGEGRPINSLDKRLAVLAGLESVDWVAHFEGDTPEALLQQLQPDVLVKGGDYSEDQVVGKEIVQAYGGEVKVMSLVPGCSTTNIVNSIKQ